MASSSMAAISSTTNLITNNNNPYLKLNPSAPTTYTTITNTGTLVPPQWQLRTTYPSSPEELIDIARRACGLMLRMEAEKVPHIHYSSNKTISVDSNSQHTDDGTIIKQESPSPVSSHQLLIRFQKLRSNRKHRRNDTHHSTTTPISYKISHIRLTRKINSVNDNNSQPQKEARETGNSRPRLMLRFGYEKEFLAGSTEKTEVGDRRIFYQRKYSCRRV